MLVAERETRIKRALTYAEKIEPGDNLTVQQRQRREEIGRGLIGGIIDVERMIRGEIPFPKRDKSWLEELKRDVDAGNFEYEDD